MRSPKLAGNCSTQHQCLAADGDQPRTYRGARLSALHRIILEITEHDAVEFYGPLTDVLEPLRKQGLRVAVDDAGAGYSSFHHILQLGSELIKLDMVLTRGIDPDLSRRALASALVWFARGIGSELVAEGVETARELRTLRDLGVKIVHGHLMAWPAPPAEINDSPAD